MSFTRESDRSEPTGAVQSSHDTQTSHIAVGGEKERTGISGRAGRPAGSAPARRAPRPVPPLPADSPRVSVVIPAKNEARNVAWLLAELPAGLHEVILVDADSSDGTVAAARAVRPDLTVIRQTRRGKGNALACGVAACTGEIAVLLDADGSADPGEIVSFVAALTGGADFAKGSRGLPGGGSADLTRLRRLGNRGLLRLMNRLYGTEFSDLCYGYNAFWLHCADRLGLPDPVAPGALFGDGFEIETVVAAHVVLAGLTVAEVPSFERERWFGHSNLNTWRDGRRVLHAMLRERVRGGPGPGRAVRADEAAAVADPEDPAKSAQAA